MNKNLKKILILLVLVLLVIFFISSKVLRNEGESLKNNSYVDEKYTEKHEKQTYDYSPQINNKYSNVMTEKEKKEISDIISSIIQLLNKKDFNALYEKLNSTSKKYMYPTYEEFEKKFMQTTAEYEYICDGYISDYYGYSCLFYPKYQYGVSKENNIDMIIMLKDNNDFEIKLDGLITAYKRNAVELLDGLNIIYNKELQYIDRTEYILTLKNVSDSAISVSFGEVYAELVQNGYVKTEYIDRIRAVRIEPQEEKVLTLTFDEYDYLCRRPEWLYLTLKINNGSLQKCDFYLKYEDFFEISEVIL